MAEQVSAEDVIEQRLLEWAHWRTGGSVGGYPVLNVLHQSWMPPAPGRLPTMASGGRSTARERTLDAAIQALSVRLQNTLVVVYLMKLPARERASRLQCEEATVRMRVLEAKRLLSQMPGVLPVNA